MQVVIIYECNSISGLNSQGKVLYIIGIMKVCVFPCTNRYSPETSLYGALTVLVYNQAQKCFQYDLQQIATIFKTYLFSGIFFVDCLADFRQT